MRACSHDGFKARQNILDGVCGLKGQCLFVVETGAHYIWPKVDSVCRPLRVPSHKDGKNDPGGRKGGREGDRRGTGFLLI